MSNALRKENAFTTHEVRIPHFVLPGNPFRQPTHNEPHQRAQSKPLSPRPFRGDTHLSIRRGRIKQRTTADIRQPTNKRSSTTYENRDPRIFPSRVGRGSKGETPAKWGFPFPPALPCGRLPSCPSVAMPPVTAPFSLFSFCRKFPKSHLHLFC